MNGRKGGEDGWMEGRRGGREVVWRDCVSVFSSDYIMMTWEGGREEERKKERKIWIDMDG